MGKNDAQLLHAANALVSQEILVVEEYEVDLFRKMDHFENLLHKFLQLEDTLLLEKLLKVCKEKSDFTALFPVLVKSGVSWTILKPAWQDYFNMAGIENGTEFLQKVHNFSFYILDVDCSRDQDRQELNVATFTGMVEKFKVLQDGETFSDIYEEMSVLGNIFIIAEVLGYNLFKFNKSLSGIFIKQVFCSSNMHPNKVGVVWVRLVTDLYSCTNLLENWEEDAEEYEDLDECAFFVRYFEVVERVGADIKGILGKDAFCMFVLFIA